MASIEPGMEADVYLVSYPRRSFRGVVQGIGWPTDRRRRDGGVLPDVRRTLNWVRLANRFQFVFGSRSAMSSIRSGWAPQPSSPFAAFRVPWPRRLRRAEDERRS